MTNDTTARTLEPKVGQKRRVSARSTRWRHAFNLGRYRVLIAARPKWISGFDRERDALYIRLPRLYLTISDSTWRATP